MTLSELIMNLIDIAIEYGDAKVYLTTENENKLYNTALLHYMPFGNSDPVLRIEGIVDDEEENEEGDDDNE